MIGIALINQCVLNNIKIYALVRMDSAKIKRLPKSDLISVLNCDFDKFLDFGSGNITSPPDTFYHIGWANTDKQGRNSPDKQLQNIQYTLDAVRLAKRLGCKKFVGIGSQAEYGRADSALNGDTPINPEIAYGIAKYAAGKFAKIECENLGLEFNWVRIVSVYGVNDNDNTLVKDFIHNCQNNRPMPLGPCTHIWDYLYEDDAGRALFAIGENGIDGKIYCLGSGTGKPLREYLEAIKNMINPGYKLDYGAFQYNEKSIRYLCADISELTADTGWKPAVSFEEGIRRTLPRVSV